MDFIKPVVALAAHSNRTSHNSYRLTIDNLDPNINLSPFSIAGTETLNTPWHYKITFTSSNHAIDIDSVLNQPASLTFEAPDILNQLKQIKQLSQIAELSHLAKPEKPRTLYGVITEFSLISVSRDEARYAVTLSSRLSLLSNSFGSAIYQNQSVISVVEELLRSHGYTGIDYRLALKDNYPVRELITQFQESDLEFMQRVLADIGVNFWFESHGKHACDVLVISDDNQHFEAAGHIAFKAPSGMVDGQKPSVWDISFESRVVPELVTTKDYNYRVAESNQQSTVNSDPKSVITAKTDYRYGEHYKNLGDNDTPESGTWYAKVRHEAHLSGQLIIKGKSNDYNLKAGQQIIIDGSSLTGIDEGVIIVSTTSYGDRSNSYECEFTAVPYSGLKPYRPNPKTWPQINGTLPARVTSPDDDTYGYIDTAGRYRVKFDFDLKRWKRGEESLWLRLAKPYAGDSYGFHFPLLDGTEVAIAFSGGNPDRPYIAHAMHDSSHPDHVSLANKHRNVIRTRANNKLRMDDKRGKEHIKLATEYGKTQLNLGHLVNQDRELRGEGFELRTDEWGAIRAAKGVQITTAPKKSATGKQLDMQETIKQLKQALDLAYSLTESAQIAGAEPAKTDEQQSLLSNVTELKEPTLSFYSDKGIASSTPENIQLSAGENVITTAKNSTSITAFNKLTIAAGKMVSLFVHKLGIKLIAAAGKVQIQAQSDEMELTAQNNIFMTSANNKVTINAKEELLLLCGGAGIRIKEGKIEEIAPHSVIHKTSNLVYKDRETITSPMPVFPKPEEEKDKEICLSCLIDAAKEGAMEIIPGENSAK
ncbi:type VI secretion system tip protein VgrG [Orbaceae bacterium ESL0721]|nr:type VI secretion system tip protein VgrG [Orbaceae bacterium ESL0721]